MVIVTPNLRSIVNGDGSVILDIPRNQMVTLNSTGAYIWDKLQQGKTVGEVIEALSRESNSDPLLVEKDVQAFLDELIGKHLLQR